MISVVCFFIPFKIISGVHNVVVFHQCISGAVLGTIAPGNDQGACVNGKANSF